MPMNYLVNQVEGAAEFCQGALLVVRSLKERGEGVSKESHVATDKKTLVAELPEHLLSQKKAQEGPSLRTGVYFSRIGVPQFFLSMRVKHGLNNRQV